MIQHKFESAFPIEAGLYLSTRFNLEKALVPSIVQHRTYSGEVKAMTLDAGIQLMQKEQEKENLIHTYKFKYGEGTLTEEVRLNDNIFLLFTEIDDILPFFQYIFPLNGVLVYGVMDKGEELICRDDIGCEFAHEIYENTDLEATWWEDNDYVNHFFAFTKEAKEKSPITDFIALGGEVFNRFDSENTNVSFYLMKAIHREGKEVYIKSSDDMSYFENYEKEIAEKTMEALQVSKVKSEIVYKVV